MLANRSTSGTFRVHSHTHTHALTFPQSGLFGFLLLAAHELAGDDPSASGAELVEGLEALEDQLPRRDDDDGVGTVHAVHFGLPAHQRVDDGQGVGQRLTAPGLRLD